MDRAKCRIVREKIDAALARLGEELGLSIKTVGAGSFSSSNLTLKIEAAELGDGGAVMSKEAEAFKLFGPPCGLPAIVLGMSFKHGGKTFTVTGWNAKARSMPIMCDAGDGRDYKFAVDTVKELIASQHGDRWAEMVAGKSKS